jgi:multidrug efflux pump subunit AcrA (membrane-fusion protein)
VKKAEAMLQIAQSERRQAEIERDRYTIKAPVDGIILSVVAPGTWVPTEGGKMLAEISNPEREEAARERNISQFEMKISEMEAELREYLKSHTDRSPEVAMKRAQISSLKQSLERERVAVEAAKKR